MDQLNLEIPPVEVTMPEEWVDMIEEIETSQCPTCSRNEHCLIRINLLPRHDLVERDIEFFIKDSKCVFYE